jgi:DNA helicase-2/ATP-dependent DNA helicase PcrA
MTVEIIKRSTFENFLCDNFQASWETLGVLYGEWVYLVPLNERVGVYIRSSIHQNDVSAEAGEDSIRVMLFDREERKHISVKTSRWITRVPGWQNRLLDAIDQLTQWHSLAGFCEKCGAPKNIFKVKKDGKNKDRMFGKCTVCNDGFVWLDEVKTAWLDEIEAEAAETDSDLTEMDISSIVDIEPRERKENSMSLNPYQLEIVEALAKGPQVIEACPGSGKTRTIENLVAALIESGENPGRIGAFTFSRNAANEMRWRIARTIWPDASEQKLAYYANPYDETLKFEYEDRNDPVHNFLVDWVCTIHALSYRMLRANGEKFRVLSGKWEWEVKELLRDSMAELDWADESLRSVRVWISRAITNLILPGNCENWFADRIAAHDGPVWNAPKLAELYRRYMAFMKAHNLIDFDMMQSRVVYKLRNDPAFRRWTQDLFDYVIVDEAQDTSDQQSEILFTLAEKSGNIVYCGDVDQSMYAFRGAQPAVLREHFESRWPEVRRFNLPINYRSTQRIVKSAASLIERNYNGPSDPYLKPFQYRDDAPEGETIGYTEFGSIEDMAQSITQLVVDSDRPGDWFVLSRTRAECAALHIALIAQGIPAINAVGGLLFGAPHVRKVLAYAQLGCNYQDARNNTEILKEIANVATVHFRAPMTRRRHIDGCDNTRSWVNCGCPIVMEEGIDYSHSRFYGARSIEEAGNWEGVVAQQFDRNRGNYPTMKAKGSYDLVSFVKRIEALQDNARLALRLIIDECALPWLQADEGLSDEDLAENGKTEDFDLLIEMIEGEMTLAQYLDSIEEITRSSSSEGENECVILATCHWAKGAERENVIVNTTRLPIVPPQTPEGKLPVGRPPAISEERRLFYVAVTRAKQACYVMHSNVWNGRETNPSQFVYEIQS